MTEQASPRELRRAERLAERRRIILKVADELFATSGYEGTSLEKIAAASGYSVGGIYNSFNSKDELYAAVLNQHVRALTDSLGADTESSASGIEKVLAMASTAVRTLRELPEHARASMTPDTDAARRNFRLVLAAYTAAITAGQRDGTVRPGEPSHLAQYVGGLVLAQTQVEQRLDPGRREASLTDFLDLLRRAVTP